MEKQSTNDISKHRLEAKSLDERFAELKAARSFPATTAELSQLFFHEFPWEIDAWRIYGYALMDMGRYTDAKHAFARAIELCSEQQLHHIYACMGNLYRRKGNHKMSARWYQKAIDNKPEDAMYYLFKGGALAEQEKFTEAEECLRRAIACNNGPVDQIYADLGFVLRAQKKYSEALTAFEQALQLNPDYDFVKDCIKDIDRVSEVGQRAKLERISHKISK